MCRNTSFVIFPRFGGGGVADLMLPSCDPWLVGDQLKGASLRAPPTNDAISSPRDGCWHSKRCALHGQLD